MFSALLNSQNRVVSSTISLTSAVFEYSNNGDDWFPIPSPFPSGTSATYDGNSYQFRVFSVSPAGATFTSSIPSPISQSGQTAQLSVTGTGSYTGTITSGVFQITQRTLIAYSSYRGGSNPIPSDTCNYDGSVAGFDFSIENLVSGDAGVTISIIYGIDIYNNTYGGYNLYAGTASSENGGYVNNQIGNGQNFIVNTDSIVSVYCNENDSKSGYYWWIICNPNEWTDDTGTILENFAYNRNYTVEIVKLMGFNAQFDNTCV